MNGTCIELLRHGEAAGGQRYRGSLDDPLTTKGWNQMHRALGDGAHWTRIVSSPLSRCREFAQHLAQRQNLAVSIDMRLREIHFGEWEGRTVDELLLVDEPRIEAFWQDPEHHPPPRGEAVSDFQGRVLEAWNELIQCKSGEHVLVVTHAGVMRIILGQVLGLPLAAALRFAIPHAHRVQLQLHNCEQDMRVRQLRDHQETSKC